MLSETVMSMHSLYFSPLLPPPNVFHKIVEWDLGRTESPPLHLTAGAGREHISIFSVFCFMLNEKQFLAFIFSHYKNQRKQLSTGKTEFIRRLTKGSMRSHSARGQNERTACTGVTKSVLGKNSSAGGRVQQEWGQRRASPLILTSM